MPYSDLLVPQNKGSVKCQGEINGIDYIFDALD